MQLGSPLLLCAVLRCRSVGNDVDFDRSRLGQSDERTIYEEELEDGERRIMELERKMEDSERELHAIRLDKEAAGAIEDLLREQSKELESYRRNLDNVEAERAHYMKQVHDLQEHIHDKERQVMDLQEQHRIAQETILCKDEQLREAQAWITQAQEMDVLHSNTNHSLQAELRERTEQYNQLWLGCQRRFVEMERLHAQNIQQLQLEIAGAREKSGTQTHTDESHVSRAISTSVPHFGQDNGGHHNANGAGSSSGDSVGASNGNAGSFKSFTTSDIASPQAAHIPGVPINPSVLGASSHLHPGQVAVHPYVIQRQGANHSVPASVPQSLIGHFPFMPPMTSYQHWQSQQGVSDALQGSSSASEAENNLNGSDSNGRYKTSANGEHLQSDYFRASLSEGMDADPVIISTGGFEANWITPNIRSVKHYTEMQKILLVGEGDFSFSACLAEAFQGATNITATSLDDRDTVTRKYTRGENSLRILEQYGATVIHQVDARTMNKHPNLKGRLFDRIVFNFPHAGLLDGGEDCIINIWVHKSLVKGFFSAAKCMLSYKGEVHVTHKTTHPYDTWNIRELASEAGLALAAEAAFDRRDYIGYENKKAFGDCWNKMFPVGKSSTFMFVSDGGIESKPVIDHDLLLAFLLASSFGAEASLN